jgi:hypothetical protein
MLSRMEDIVVSIPHINSEKFLKHAENKISNETLSGKRNKLAYVYKIRKKYCNRIQG